MRERLRGPGLRQLQRRLADLRSDQARSRTARAGRARAARRRSSPSARRPRRPRARAPPAASCSAPAPARRPARRAPSSRSAPATGGSPQGPHPAGAATATGAAPRPLRAHPRRLMRGARKRNPFCGEAAYLEAFEHLDEVTRRLRRECPWDREQDARSIVPHTVEEAYELADAAKPRRHRGDGRRARRRPLPGPLPLAAARGARRGGPGGGRRVLRREADPPPSPCLRRPRARDRRRGPLASGRRSSGRSRAEGESPPSCPRTCPRCSTPARSCAGSTRRARGARREAAGGPADPIRRRGPRPSSWSATLLLEAVAASRRLGVDPELALRADGDRRAVRSNSFPGPMSTIESVHGRQVLDSRGNPTVEVEVVLDVRRSGPRDGALGRLHRRVRGGRAARRRRRAVRRQGRRARRSRNVNGEIADASQGADAAEQSALDRTMIELDGTPNKGRLGANAILGVSLAAAKAPRPTPAAALPLWRLRWRAPSARRCCRCR